jgi:hypothetical protein
VVRALAHTDTVAAAQRLDDLIADLFRRDPSIRRSNADSVFVPSLAPIPDPVKGIIWQGPTLPDHRYEAIQAELRQIIFSRAGVPRSDWNRVLGEVLKRHNVAVEQYRHLFLRRVRRFVEAEPLVPTERDVLRHVRDEMDRKEQLKADP